AQCAITSGDWMNHSNLYFRSFLLLLAAVTIAFIWILLPFYGAIFWGTILAVIFMPLNRRLLGKLQGHRNLAALITLLIVLLIVIIPVILITASLLQEGAVVYKRITSGELNLGAYFEQIMNALPASVHDTLTRFGVGDIFSLREKLSASALQGSKFLVTPDVTVGQNTAQFLIGLGIMLYMLFFLLRDGVQLARQARHLI